MISKIDPSILFKGASFSPALAEKITGLLLENKIEVGEMLKEGKDLGKISEFGQATLLAPQDILEEEKLLWLLTALESKLDTFYELGAEETRIYVGYFYEDQCNITLTKEEIKILAKLDIDLWVSCYEDS